jgi:hypothetical protein
MRHTPPGSGRGETKGQSSVRDCCASHRRLFACATLSCACVLVRQLRIPRRKNPSPLTISVGDGTGLVGLFLVVLEAVRLAAQCGLRAAAQGGMAQRHTCIQCACPRPSVSEWPSGADSREARPMQGSTAAALACSTDHEAQREDDMMYSNRRQACLCCGRLWG